MRLNACLSDVETSIFVRGMISALATRFFAHISYRLMHARTHTLHAIYTRNNTSHGFNESFSLWLTSVSTIGSPFLARFLSIPFSLVVLARTRSFLKPRLRSIAPRPCDSHCSLASDSVGLSVFCFSEVLRGKRRIIIIGKERKLKGYRSRLLRTRLLFFLSRA